MTSSGEARVRVQDSVHQGLRGAILLLPVVPVLAPGLLLQVPWLHGPYVRSDQEAEKGLTRLSPVRPSEEAVLPAF